MSLASFNTKIYKTGSSLAFTDEGATLIVGTTKTFKIDDANKAIFDLATVPTAEDGGVPAQIDVYDVLAGTVTLTNAPGGAVTITGKYLPKTKIGSANAHRLQFDRELFDSSDGDSGENFSATDAEPGILSGTVEITDLDVTQVASSLLNGGSDIVLEIKMSVILYRLWATPKTDKIDSAIKNLSKRSRTFLLSDQVHSSNSANLSIEVS
jgi:hypothetical protein